MTSELWLFHIPVKEFKEAYEKMKMGDKAVVYKHGNIGEAVTISGFQNLRALFLTEQWIMVL